MFGWASFSFAPFAYLYVRSVLEQAYRFKKWDFLLFLPAVLYTASLLPFYLQSAEQKRIFLEEVIKDPGLILREPEGIFPPGLGSWLRVILGVLTTAGQFIQLKKWKPKIFDWKGSATQNIITYQWLFLFSLVQALFYAFVIIGFIINFTWKVNNHLIIFSICSTIVFYSIYLLLKPSILYGMKNWMQDADIAQASREMPEPDLPSVTQVQKRYTLSLEQRAQFKTAMEDHFLKNSPYLRSGYAISDLSREIGIPPYQLSAFINQEFGLNFNEFINEKRVAYLSELLKNSPEHYQYTLEAIGKMAGFNSRTAFFSAVKKITGKSPSEYFVRHDPHVTD
jgi:AraC-like DNA-binding protein